MSGRWHLCETLVHRLPQDLEHMAAEPRQLIQHEHPIVRQRHLPRHGDLAPTDQSDIRDGMLEATTRAGGKEGHAIAGEAGDERDGGGVEALCQRQPQQTSGKAGGPLLSG
jgi:hypothetical protein